MNDRYRTMKTALFFGGLWGLSEATLGYILHWLPNGLSGSIMFPLAVYFMLNAAKQSSDTAIPLTAIIAAAIKLLNLALPLRSAMSAVNPAVSILLESAVVLIFVRVLNGQKTILKSAAMSGLWLGTFLGVQALVIHPVHGMYLLPTTSFLMLLGINMSINTLLIALYMNYRHRLNQFLAFPRYSLTASVPLLFIAMIIELGQSLI